MILLLPFCLSFDATISLRSGNIGYHIIPLDQGDTVTVSSQDAFFFAYFIRTSGVRISLYIDDALFKMLIDTSEIAGVDSGSHIMRIIFRADSATELMFSALVFPKDCKARRLVTSLPFFLLAMSRQAADPDLRIEHNQHFCFWPANPTSHYMTVTTHTESDFDLLKLYHNVGLVTVFFGHGPSVIHSPDGAEFFIWHTDIDGLSDNFSIQITTNSPIQFPVFSKMLTEAHSQQVSLVFVRQIDPLDPWTFPSQNPDERPNRTLICVVSAVTVVLTVMAALSVAWAARVVRAYREDFGNDSDDEGGEGYHSASDGALPVPFYAPQVGDPGP
jgi:hypothetical protein